MSEREADEIASWGANVVRVPLNQDRLLHGWGGSSAEDYACELDTLVSWYSARDIYVLFDLHWLDDRRAFGLNRDGSVNRVPPLPDAGSVDALSGLAARFRDQPAVLYEIFNEPHTPIADPLRPDRDDRAIALVPDEDGSLRPCERRRVTMAEWHAWAPMLVRAIRDVHADALVFVPGVDWAYDLRGMPLDGSLCSMKGLAGEAPADAGVVYSTHVYSRNRREPRQNWIRSLNRAPGWDEAFGDLHRSPRVLNDGWGERDLQWGSDLAAYLEERQLGWTAWSCRTARGWCGTHSRATTRQRPSVRSCARHSHLSDEMSERFHISVPGTVGVSGLSYPAAERTEPGVTLLLGHGAGSPQESRWMVAYANGLSSRGIDVVTFNFLYMEQRRRMPDRTEQLEACYRAAMEAARDRTPANRLAIGGKSMGGRIASQVAAALPDGGADLLGLVFLGYPLHPPGQPRALRTSHLPRVHAPMLFVQGTRDPFGTPDELAPVIATLAPRATLHAVTGGDHSLNPPKKNGTSEADVQSLLHDRITRWLREQI